MVSLSRFYGIHISSWKVTNEANSFIVGGFYMFLLRILMTRIEIQIPLTLNATIVIKLHLTNYIMRK